MGYQEQRAIHAYAQFIKRYSPASAHNVPVFGARDTDSFLVVVTVSREVVLNRFLSTNKEFERFRRELAGFNSASQPTGFPLDKERWEAAN
jgi:hypothetical protein